MSTIVHLMSPDVTHGEVIFQQNCLTCHSGGKNMIVKQKTLQKGALEEFIGLKEGDASRISDFVKSSDVHRGALAFSGRLSDQDFEDVASYVYKQAMEDKW